MKRRFLCFAFFALLGSCQSPATEGITPSGSPSSTAYPEVTATETKAPLAAAPTDSATSTPSWTPSPTPTPTEDDSPVNLAFVGDIMLGRSLGERISRGEGGTIFASVESTLQSADLAAGNLECALGEGGVREKKYYTFLAPPQSAALLKSAGFDLMSLANNHVLDFGSDVFAQTLRLFDENGLAYVGAGSNEARAHAPAVFEIRGFRVAFLAYVEVPKEYIGGFDPKVWTAGPDSPGVAWAEDGEIRRDLESLAPEADFTVVLFHFGDEGANLPNPRQIELARLAVDHGADLVVGSHPHLLQAAEEYRGKWIFYSLGNFVFDEFTDKGNRSAILWITVSRNGPVEYSLLLLNIVDGIPRIGE